MIRTAHQLNLLLREPTLRVYSTDEAYHTYLKQVGSVRFSSDDAKPRLVEANQSACSMRTPGRGLWPGTCLVAEC
jgi:hypothetical protein